MLEDRRQAVRRQYQQQQREQEQREKDNPNKQYRLYCGSNTKFILPEQKVDPNAR